jgi:hypothetical protein
MMDVLLYGEGWWDLETLVHLNPNRIRMDKEGFYVPLPEPLTIDDILKKSKKSDKVAA